jgi:hypothetical protein
LDRARESVEISFYRERKCFCFFSFPKKEFLPVRIDSQCSQSGDVLTRVKSNVGPWLGNGFTAERVYSLMGVQLNGCIDERVCSLHGCASLPRRIPLCLSDGTNLFHWTTSVKNRHVLECGHGASSVLLSRIFFFRVKPS